MENRYLVGIDIGTQASKGVLVSIDGSIVATAEVEHGVLMTHPGWAEQDADAIWWGDFCQVCQHLIRHAEVDPHTIIGVGFSTISPTVLILDEKGCPLRPGIIYSDLRGAEEADSLRERISLGRPLTGWSRSISPRLMSVKLLWLRRHEPCRWHKTYRVVTAQAYLVWRLTGCMVIDAQTAMGFYPIFDVERHCWDDRILQSLEMSSDLFPPVRPATAIAGAVTEEASRSTGLAPGTPVITGTVDAYAGWIAAGLSAPHEACVLLGTTLCVAALVDHPIAHPSLFGGAFLFPGSYYVGGATIASMALTRWFRDNFGIEETKAQHRLGIDAYHLLALEAESVPAGSDGLVILPYFAGERSPIDDEDARGLIIGLTLQHSRRHLYRAILEGIAYSFRHIVDTMNEAGVVVKRVTAAGGGSRSRLFLQICADVLELPIRRRHDTAGSALGDAYLAGYALGSVPSYSEAIPRWNPIIDEIQPRASERELYTRLYRVYRDLYEKTCLYMHALARIKH